MPKKLVLAFSVDDKGSIKLKKVNKHVKNLGETAKKSASQSKGIFKGFLGAQVAYKGLALITNGLKAAAEEAIKFQRNIKNIQAITGTSMKDLTRISKLAKEIARNTEHSASAVAAAGLDIAKLGFGNLEVLNILPQTMDLATASMVDASEAGQVLGQTLKSFRLEAQESERVANVIQSTVSGTAIGFRDYAEALKYVAPISTSLNVSVEETSALLGQLGNIGLRGSIGGTTLKNIMLNLMKPSKEVAKALKAMKLEGLSLTDTLGGLHAEGIGVKDFLETFNKRAVVGSLGVSAMSDKVNKLTVDLEAQRVKVKNVADEMRDTLDVQLKVTGNLFKDFFLNDKFASGLQKWLKDFNGELRTIVKIMSSQKGRKTVKQEKRKNWLYPDLSVTGIAKKNLELYMAANTAVNKMLIDTGKLAFEHMKNRAKETRVLTLIKDEKLETLKAARKEVDLLRVMYKQLDAAKDDADQHLTDQKEGKMHYSPADRRQDKAFIQEIEDDIKDSALDIIRTFDTLTKGNVENIERVMQTLGALDKEIISREPIKKIKKKVGKYDPHADDDDDDKDGKGGKSRWTDPPKIAEYIPQHQDFGIKEQSFNSINSQFATPDFLPAQFYGEKFDTSKAAGLTPSSIGDKNMDQKMQETVTSGFREIDFEGRSQAYELYINNQVELSQKEFETLISEEELYLSNKSATFGIAQEMTTEFYNIMGIIEENKHQETMRRWEKEARLLTETKNRELAIVGKSLVGQQVAENKYAKFKKDLDKKQAQEDLQRRKESQRRGLIEAGINSGIAITQIWSDSSLPSTWLKVAMTVLAAGSLAANIASVASANYRYGGSVEGVGGPTSDSVPALLSRGEYVVDSDTVDRVGGATRLEESLDRSEYAGGNQGVTNNFYGTVIGEEEYVRELMERQTEEEVRW